MKIGYKVKLLLLVMLLNVFMIMPVSADVDKVYQDKDTNTMCVEGTAGSNYKKMPLTLTLKDEEGNVKDIRLVQTDEQGMFECLFPLEDITEKYTLYVKSAKSVVSFTEKEILCFAMTHVDDAFTAFKLADTIAKMKSVIEDIVPEINYSYGNVLGFDTSMLQDINNNNNFYEKLINVRNVGTVSQAVEKISEAALCAIFEGADESDICNMVEKYKDKTEIEKSDLYESYVSLDKEDFAKLMEKTKFDVMADIYNGFEKNVVLTLIKNSTYYADTKKYILDNKDILGIKLNDYNDLSSVKQNNVMKLLTGYSASTVEEFLKHFNNIVATVPANLNGTSTGGSGGSGGKGGKGSFSATFTPPVNTNTNTNANTATFVDLENVSWAKEAILSLSSKGIVSGKKEFLFYPLDNITRAEFVKILVGVLELDIVEKDIAFEDVSLDDWCYKYISTAVKNGIVNGISDTYFGKNDTISRQDMVTMTIRALRSKKIAIPETELNFEDTHEINNYAKESVSAANALGLVNGVGNNMFAPNAYSTRAEAAKVLYEVMKLL